MRILLLSLSLCTGLLLMSCSSNIHDYADTQPAFELDSFFNGELVAHGMVQDRSGRVLRRFSVEMIGRWDGNKGVLEEDFVYEDGEQQRRVWRLEKGPDGQYSGTADDVVVPATGQTQGFALNWRYTLAVPVDGKIWNIDFNDWMYLLDENRVLNRAEMTKWGFKVGEVTLWIERKNSEG
ncbi:DUF3833 domain-containing protein [Oceanisphaera sediminis]|uniref:DUF3833 domain-containing protein n=1 Tax=Oceanisphaera sediminis TaxID=981381 RepID=A0ABP7EJ55_9GAMM